MFPEQKGPLGHFNLTKQSKLKGKEKSWWVHDQFGHFKILHDFQTNVHLVEGDSRVKEVKLLYSFSNNN